MPSSSGERGDVVGAVLEAERLGRSQAPPVAAMIEGDDAEVLGERGEAGEPVEVGGRRPAVEQHERRGTRRAGELADERPPAAGQPDVPARRQPRASVSWPCRWSSLRSPIAPLLVPYLRCGRRPVIRGRARSTDRSGSAVRGRRAGRGGDAGVAPGVDEARPVEQRARRQQHGHHHAGDEPRRPGAERGEQRGRRERPDRRSRRAGRLGQALRGGGVVAPAPRRRRRPGCRATGSPPSRRGGWPSPSRTAARPTYPYDAISGTVAAAESTDTARGP